MPLTLKFPWPLFGPARESRHESAPDTLELRSARLLLRPLRESDAEALFVCASDLEVTRFLPWHPASNLDTVRVFLKDQIGRRKSGLSLGMGIVVLESGELIGSVDLMGLHAARKSGTAEMGYLLARSWWGRGITTEAARLAMNYGFESFALRRLVAFADRENAASRRVLEKLGMRATGDELRNVKSEERMYLRYEIARHEWELQNR